ncbi:hypothetical protein [Candidatus Allofournierella merdipullorum]|uniref:hypothetical protein n=1 Tax=Candidatus Allofournierella merdipullorum TaxID=2838595 RepID=UPI002A8A2563|nr:hypothetical protein [Candidatus Fournierella merdipullorum]
MSIQTEISRIQSARDSLRTKAIELKISAGTEKLDELAEDYDGIENQGSVSAQVKEGETYTIPKGYHDGTGTVSGVAGGGSYNLQSKSITPTKKPQQVTPDEGFYGLSDVSVGAIPSQFQDVSSVTATGPDVLAGKMIVTSDGSVVAGEMVDNGSVKKTLDATTPSFTIPKGSHDGTGAVNIVPEQKTVTPSESKQTISPTAGKVITQVVVEAIPANYKDVSGVTAVKEHVLTGDKFVGPDGILTEGTMPNNGTVNGEIDGLSSTSFSVPIGYTDGGTVNLTGDIEAALAAI